MTRAPPPRPALLAAMATAMICAPFGGASYRGRQRPEREGDEEAMAKAEEKRARKATKRLAERDQPPRGASKE